MIKQIFVFAAAISIISSSPVLRGYSNVMRVPSDISPEYITPFDLGIPIIEPPGFRQRFGIQNPIEFPRPEVDRFGNRNPISVADLPVPFGEFPTFSEVDPVTKQVVPDGTKYVPFPRKQFSLPKGELPLYVPIPAINPQSGMENPAYAPYINALSGLSRYIAFQVDDINTARFPKTLTSMF